MYGKEVEGMSRAGDKYGFIDEYQVRIEAGIALFFATYAFVAIVFFGFFTIPTIVIGILWLDFIFKIFLKPESLFFGKLAKIIVEKGLKTKPYYVGALQKKFAWKVGLVLSTFAFFCIMIVSGFLPGYGIAVEGYEMVQAMTKPSWMAVPFTPPLVACIICIIFMSLESVFGYCVGCNIYVFLIKKGIVKKVEGQNCVNGVCDILK